MESLDQTVTDSVGHIIIQRADVANSLNTPTKTAIIETLREWENGEDVRVVVIQGEGDEAFCSGGDITEIPEHDFSLEYFIDSWEELFTQMRTMSQPIIAKVNGHAVGGGFDLVLYSDIAIAADDAHLAQPEIGLGIVNHFSPPVLLDTVGLKKTMGIMLTGESISGAEAAELGLVTKSVPESELNHATDDVVDSLLAKSPRVLERLKEGIYTSSEMSPTTSRSYLRRVALTSKSEDGDYREGIEAQLEGREPEWIT